MKMKMLATVCVLSLIVIGCVVFAGCTTVSDLEKTRNISASTEQLLDNYQNNGNSPNPYMILAIDEGNKGIENDDGGPFGCVIVKDGEVVGRGHNCVVVNNDPTAHGEIMAIRDAGKNLKTFDLSGCDLYTTGEPCPMCMAAIYWANIGNVYYGCTVEDADSIGFSDKVFYDRIINQRIHGVELDRDACLILFEKYRNMKNRTPY